MATTLKVALCPAVTVWPAGWVVIVGTVGFGLPPEPELMPEAQPESNAAREMNGRDPKLRNAKLRPDMSFSLIEMNLSEIPAWPGAWPFQNTYPGRKLQPRLTTNT